MISIRNLGSILIISIVIIALIWVILLIKGRKDNKKAKQKDLSAFYISEIEKLDKSDTKNVLSSLDKITRNFFGEAFRIKKFVGYSELKKIFNKKSNAKAVEFCELMSKALYSKEKNNGKIQKLINLLTEIVKDNPRIVQQP